MASLAQSPPPSSVLHIQQLSLSVMTQVSNLSGLSRNIVCCEVTVFHGLLHGMLQA